MTQKHTQEEWFFEESDFTIRTKNFKSRAGMGDHKGVIIAELDSPEWRKCAPESIPIKKANGHLIAQAPALLAKRDRLREINRELIDCLKELVDLMEDTREGAYTPDSFTTQPAREALARAAIATSSDEGTKAEGKEEK